MATTTHLVTANNLYEMGEDAPYELVRGSLRAVAPTGGMDGRVGIRFGGRLDAYVDQHALGAVYGAETGFVIEVGPDTVLAPDVAFIRTDRLPLEDDEERFVPVVPDLVVDLISPSNRRREIEEKVRLYLDAGVRMVVLVYPRRRSIDIVRSAHDWRTLAEGDDFDGQVVVPGFRISVSELFRSPIRSNPD